MLDKETINRLSDFFTAADLIEYLEESKQVSVDDIIDIFDEEIESAIDDLEELMGVSRDD